MKKKRRNYTKEFKEEAVKLITEQGYSYAEAGRNLGIHPNLLSKWHKEHEGIEDGYSIVVVKLDAVCDPGVSVGACP